MIYLAKIKRQIVFAAVITSPSVAFEPANIPIESTILFSTACARCHEGECSGRLSFPLTKDATDKHIRRYGGALPLETTRQLSKLLRYMKEECSYYPFSLALLDDRIWYRDTLATLQAPSKQAYFIPLGHLEAGLYQLSFEGLKENDEVRIEILNQQFDYSDKEDIYKKGETTRIIFRADEGSVYFLRIVAQEPIYITRAELVYR